MPAIKVYRLRWEMLDTRIASDLASYYGDEFANVLAAGLAGSVNPWRPVIKESDDDSVLDQFCQLKDWADRDVAGIRNVKLEEAEQEEGCWTDVTDRTSR